MPASFSLITKLTGISDRPLHSIFLTGFASPHSRRYFSGNRNRNLTPARACSSANKPTDFNGCSPPPPQKNCPASRAICSALLILAMASMFRVAPESSPIRFTNGKGMHKRSCVRKYSLCFSRNSSDDDDCSTSRPYCVIAYALSGCFWISLASLRRWSCRKASVAVRSSVRANSCILKLFDCSSRSILSLLSLASSNSSLSSPSVSPNTNHRPEAFHSNV